MVVYCSVCKSKGEKGFFRYPSGEFQRAECLRIAGLPPEPELKVKIGGLRICYRHFQANDLLVVNNKVTLHILRYVRYVSIGTPLKYILLSHKNQMEF